MRHEIRSPKDEVWFACHGAHLPRPIFLHLTIYPFSTRIVGKTLKKQCCCKQVSFLIRLDSIWLSSSRSEEIERIRSDWSPSKLKWFETNQNRRESKVDRKSKKVNWIKWERMKNEVKWNRTSRNGADRSRVNRIEMKWIRVGLSKTDQSKSKRVRTDRRVKEIELTSWIQYEVTWINFTE